MKTILCLLFPLMSFAETSIDFVGNKLVINIDNVIKIIEIKQEDINNNKVDKIVKEVNERLNSNKKRSK